MRRIRLPAVMVLVAHIAPTTWAADGSITALDQWTEGRTLEAVRDAKPPFGSWAEKDGHLVAEGTAPCWDTRLLPGDQGSDTQVTVRFTIQASSKQKRPLPGGYGFQRWGYHWEENAPGWDVGVVLRWKDALNFYRVQLSVERQELALWDSTGAFLQLIPCEVKLKKTHTLQVTSYGAHFIATLDGKRVMDYWDRSLPHKSGQVGLSVWQSKVQFDKFHVLRAKPGRLAMPPHKPSFHFKMEGRHYILFDGHEPLCRYQKVRGNMKGAMFMGNVKLMPGYRPAYYSFIGPGLRPGPGYRVLKLVGELPDAFTGKKKGKELNFSFVTENPGIAKADHTCTVRYDAQRGVYRYEYRVGLRFSEQLSEKPYKLHSLEIMDPLTFNNRDCGPEVWHRWNWAGHQWHVFEGPERTWQRYPLIDYLYGGPATAWGKFTTFLYPDPAACPAFEVDLGWKQEEKRSFRLPMCLWGYDFHHMESGPTKAVVPGSRRDYGITLTALPPAEADALFEKSEVDPDTVARSKQQFPDFEPAGNTFTKLSTRQNPTSTMVWEVGKIDKTVGRMDNSSMLFDGPAKSYVRMYQYVIQKHGVEKWWARGYYKSKDVKGRGLELRIKYSYGDKPEDVFYLGGRGSCDWTYFSFVTEVLKRGDSTDITFELDGSGKIWLDDFAISALKPGDEPKQTSWPLPTDLKPRTDVLIDLPMSRRPGSGVYDASHNGHNLTFYGGVKWVTEDGRGFLRLDGVDDAGRITTQTALAAKSFKTPAGPRQTKFPMDAFTYEMWFRPNERDEKTANLVALWSYGQSFLVYLDDYKLKDKSWQLNFRHHRRQPQDGGAPTEKITLTHRVPVGRWAHFVATHDDTHVTIYINGQQVARQAFSKGSLGFEFTSYQNLYHVGSYNGAQHFFRGDIGPMRLYSKALSADEVAERFKSGWPAK